MHKRLQDSSNVDNCKPVISGGNVRYELASKAGGTAYGGMAAIVAFAKKIRLPDRIDTALHIFKKHQPFHESDHVLNFAYNALCGGTCLQDMERRRNDEFFLDAIGAERIPDPTTAGNFCRRFSAYHIQRLQEAFDEVRLNVWKEQDQAFFAQATIDMDGTIVQTTGQCKAGMDICYKGMWGYHPLVLTLAETGEVLRLVNRSGNQRCDQENILAQLNQCRALHAPVDNLESNWAFMVMTSLSWSLKAWIALSIPVTGRWANKHKQERNVVLRMEFKNFIEQFVRLPAQVIRSGRQITIRL